MRHDMRFGAIAADARPHGIGARRFRLAVLGDFSGRHGRLEAETGAALASRRPRRVDAETFDRLMATLAPGLALDLGAGQPVALEFADLDAFHPDRLSAAPFFGALLSLRRDLTRDATFERAAATVLAWSGAEALPPAPQRRVATVPNRKLPDFARLVGQPAPPSPAERSVEALLRRIVGPHVHPQRDARQDQLVARVDEGLSAALRRVLHDASFQMLEATWRGLDLLVRRIETGVATEVVVYDVSAAELAADLAGTGPLAESALHGMLVEQPSLDADQGPFSAVIVLHEFTLSPPHLALLGRAARIAAAAGAPMLAAVAPEPLLEAPHAQHPLVREALGALRALPEAAYLLLASPRFLLRLPYGRRTDPVEPFAFEEFTRQSGLRGMLWGNPALLGGLLLAQSWSREGAAMRPGSILAVDDLPYLVMHEPDGKAVALPCTERLWSEREATRVAEHGVVPALSLRGRPEVRLAGLRAVNGEALAGFWAPGTSRAAGAAGRRPAAEPDDAASMDMFGRAGPVAPAAAPPRVEPGAPMPPTAPVPAEAAPEPTAPDADAAELDALLAGMGASPEPAPDDAEAELDALLASLDTASPPAEPDETERELDALLASLK